MDSKIDEWWISQKCFFLYNDIYIYIYIYIYLYIYIHIAKLSFVFLCKYDYDNLDLSWDMR